jgi:hypothetical protein
MRRFKGITFADLEDCQGKAESEFNILVCFDGCNISNL